MINESTYSWHPTDEGLYWYKQGMAHINGSSSKRESIKDAARCFHKGLKYGDNAAAYDYAFLICKGCVEESIDVVKSILEDLWNKNLLSPDDQSFLIGDYNLIEEFLKTTSETTSASGKTPPEKITTDLENDPTARASVIRRSLEYGLKKLLKKKKIELDSKMGIKDMITELYGKNIIDYKCQKELSKINHECNSRIHVDDLSEKTPSPISNKQFKDWTNTIKQYLP